MIESIPFTVEAGTPVIVRYKNVDGEDVEMRIGVVVMEVTDSGDPEDDKNFKRYVVSIEYRSRVKVLTPKVVKDVIIKGEDGK